MTKETIEMLKTRNFDKAGLSEEEIKGLAGLRHEKKYKELMDRAPKGLRDGKLAKFVRENMGEKPYEEYIHASKALSYRIKRAEELLGLEQFKANKFDEFKGVAYPMYNSFVKNANGEYEIKLITDFTFNNRVILLTNEKTGYNTPRHELQKQLIEALQEAVKEQDLDGEVIFEQKRNIGEIVEKLSITYRLTIEKIRK